MMLPSSPRELWWRRTPQDRSQRFFRIVNQGDRPTAQGAHTNPTDPIQSRPTERSQNALQRVVIPDKFRSAVFPGRNAGASLKHRQPCAWNMG